MEERDASSLQDGKEYSDSEDEDDLAERVGWQKVARRIRVPMGFLFAGVFLWLARPTAATMFGSFLLVAPGLWLRGYAAGYVKKNEELTTTGPYGYTRNPLYLGSMMIAFGFALAGGRWSIGIALAGLFLAIYLPVIRGEEEFLRGRFAEFDEYAARVPRLLPRLTKARVDSNDSSVTRFDAQMAGGSDRGAFSRPLYLHHREYNALMGAGAIYFALAIRLLLRQ